MSLALPTLVILLGLLPGICCFYGYFAGRFDKRTAAVSGVGELALYVLFAIPIDAFALAIFRRVGIALNFPLTIRLLTGTVPDGQTLDAAAAYFRAYTSRMTEYYLVLLAFSFVLGSVFRRVVWACRLDTKIPHLRIRNEWFYVLQGRLSSEFPRDVVSYVDVLTDMEDQDGAKTRLYRGVVVDFETTPTGSIDSITLRNAKRGKGRGKEFNWVDIPSSRLIITGSKIHTINVTYIAIERSDPKPRRLKPIRRWFRSFLWGEP